MINAQPGDRITILAVPGASKTEYVRFMQARNAHKIRIAAPPEKGKANEELITFLHEEFGLRCALENGVGSRKKVLRVL